MLQLLLSRRATALPISFLMLFVSLVLITSATYYVSVAKIQARGQLLNIAVAKQNMNSLENSIEFTLWSPGTSRICYFEDAGGILRTNQTEKRLLVNITDNVSHLIAYNDSVGKAVYELPSAEIAVSTVYIKGDRRAVINQSSFTMTQLYLSPTPSPPELTLSYRPLATIRETDYNQGKPVNTLRLYIISLTASTQLTALGKCYVKSTCANVTSNVETYDFSYPITYVFVRSILGERSDAVKLPVSSSVAGAFLRLETLVCHVKLERLEGT